jgi:ABC-2 type transport system ATP-binding protein
MLRINQLEKKYGGRRALDGLTFGIDKGEIVGFLGLNGAGKTTTMKIIAGCLTADSGTVTVGGLDIRNHPLETKSLIGYLPENNPLYDGMTVAEYLEYVAGIYRISNKKKAVGAALTNTGLRSEACRKIGQLSKGYRQRVGLAQALVHDPELLLLDEPVTGLDPQQVDELNALLLRLRNDKAILLSSHVLSEVQSVCTRILIIHEGKLLLDKSKDEIDDLASTFRDQLKVRS